MGYVAGLRRLYARGRRCRRAWAPHVEQSRALIVQAAQECTRRRRVLVVGSGPLFDVPLAQLSWRFKEVVLVDIVHLGRSRLKIRRFANARAITADVTGMAEAVYDWAQSGCRGAFPDRKPAAFPDGDFDLVVSCNILSQLPLSVVRYARRCGGERAMKDEADMSRRMVLRHLDWLASFDAAVCLIADTHQQHWVRGRMECDNDILWGVVLPAGARQWVWDLAPRPEVSDQYDVKHCVAGYVRFPKEAWRTGSAGAEADSVSAAGAGTLDMNPE